jgi:hypothetical protein
MPADGSTTDDGVLASLVELAASSGELSHRINRFSAMARTGRRIGLSYRESLPLERRLELVEQVVSAIRILVRHGNAFRRMEARALYAEGLTMSQLAAVFGVSRQRIAALLGNSADKPSPLPRGGEPIG